MSGDEKRDRSRDKITHYRKRAKYEKAGRLAAEARIAAAVSVAEHWSCDHTGFDEVLAALNHST